MSLEVKNINFQYKREKKTVLRDFSAEFPYGEITAVTGKNGTGKTTLARIIVGILKPQSGSVFLDGEDLCNESLAQRGLKIGYVMQNPERQIFSETVAEEVQYGLRNLQLSEEEIQERVDTYLEFFGLSHQKESFPFALSHGEKQRLVLAAILAMKPRYLILDEPTASLDKNRRKVLGDYLTQLDCGVILISHDKDFIDAYCNNVIRMEDIHE